MLQRHIHGAAADVDDPLVTYNTSNTSIWQARFLSTEARGSVVYSANRYNSVSVV